MNSDSATTNTSETPTERMEEFNPEKEEKEEQVSFLNLPKRKSSSDQLPSTELAEPEIKSAKVPPPPVYVIIGQGLKEMLIGLLKSAYWSTKQFLIYIKYHPNHAGIVLILLAFTSLLFTTGKRLHDNLVLTRISDDAVAEIAKASRFQRYFTPDSVTKNGTRALLNVGAPAWIQHESIKAVLTEARKAELSLHHQAALLATVDIESGFNPMARASTTTACGLFQFIRHTGNVYNLPPRTCMDPHLNAKAGIAHYIDNYHKRVEKEVADLPGVEKLFRTFELTYYLHHDGPNSSNPSNDLKATVLNGTPFLFRTYEILELEARNQSTAPTYLESLADEIVKSIKPIAQMITLTQTKKSPEGNRSLQGKIDDLGKEPISSSRKEEIKPESKSKTKSK